MSDDPTIKALLVSYEKTAQKLSDGIEVEKDELYRFMGLTGILSVQMQRQLWTQKELEDQIKALQEKRCLTCPNSLALAKLMEAASPIPPLPPSAPESKQGVWTMLATSFAQNMRLFIILVVLSLLAVALTIIVSGKIEETGKAVATATAN